MRLKIGAVSQQKMFCQVAVISNFLYFYIRREITAFLFSDFLDAAISIELQPVADLIIFDIRTFSFRMLGQIKFQLQWLFREIEQTILLIGNMR